jgi:hypothetical protein
MISLGLTNILPSQRLDLLPDVSLSLAETVSWCSRDPLQMGKLRNPMLDPSAVLELPSLEKLGIDAFVKATRQSYQQATDLIKRQRSELLRSVAIQLADISAAQTMGRLLIYEPMETVSDGAASALSHGFFDVEDAPPWDTWFWYAAGIVFSWVPESLVSNAQAGIDANPVDCIRWADWSKLPAPLHV